MKPAPFEYLRPATVAEAVEALAAHPGEAKALAGGQSLVPLMNLRLARPAVLVDLDRVAGLDGIEERDGYLAIGAMVRHEQLVTDPTVRRTAPLLAAAAAWIGHSAIRHRGTIGGSLAHADPAAELPTVAVALRAELVAAGPAGTSRSIPAGEFFLGPLTTALDDGELLTEIRIPLPPAGRQVGFAEFARRHGDFALVLAAAVVDSGSVRVVLGGVGPVPVAVSELDELEGIDPPSDLHASSRYRRAVVKVLVERALEQAR
jgi:carbon-monoxide dehydrogenase medium subunit